MAGSENLHERFDRAEKVGASSDRAFGLVIAAESIHARLQRKSQLSRADPKPD